MYSAHFGLTSEPFALTPDPAFFYLSPSHAEALAALKVGLQSRRGLMVMTGEVGTGKTTLLYSMLDELGPRIRSAYVTNTTLPFDDMLGLALADLGVSTPTRTRVELLTALNEFLGRCAADGDTVALFIDEAQNLQDEAFENLRLLSNFETFSTKLLQIVLVGQPELEAMLRRPQLRQVAERVAVHCHVNPLTRRESQRYLAHRLHCAGGAPRLFTSAARRLVLRKAQGIPRRINILCDNALLFAYGRGARRVTRAQVRAAVREREGRGLVTLRRPAPQPQRGWLRPAGVVGFTSLAVAAATVLAPRAKQVETLRPWLGNALSEAPANEPPSVMPAQAGIQGDGGGRVEASIAPAVPPAGDDATQLGRSLALPALAPDKATEPPPANEPPSVMPAEAGTHGDGAGRAQGGIPAVAGMTDTVSPATRDTEHRTVLVQRGTSLEALMRATYGTVNPTLLRLVRAANPQITDPDRILAGDTLVFPGVELSQNDPSPRQP